MRSPFCLGSVPSIGFTTEIPMRFKQVKNTTEIPMRFKQVKNTTEIPMGLKQQKSEQK